MNYTTPTPGIFETKPVEVAACQWTGNNLMELVTFVQGAPDVSTDALRKQWHAYKNLVDRVGLSFALAKGSLNLSPGDWVIKDTVGDFYRCEKHLFNSIYRQKSEAPSAVFAVVYVELTHVPGDQRSIEHPGHGYPAHTLKHNIFKSFEDEKAWREWIDREMRRSSPTKFSAYRCIPVEVSSEVKVNIN